MDLAILENDTNLTVIYIRMVFRRNSEYSVSTFQLWLDDACRVSYMEAFRLPALSYRW